MDTLSSSWDHCFTSSPPRRCKNLDLSFLFFYIRLPQEELLDLLLSFFAGTQAPLSKKNRIWNRRQDICRIRIPVVGRWLWRHPPGVAGRGQWWQQDSEAKCSQSLVTGPFVFLHVGRGWGPCVWCRPILDKEVINVHCPQTVCKVSSQEVLENENVVIYICGRTSLSPADLSFADPPSVAGSLGLKHGTWRHSPKRSWGSHWQSCSTRLQVRLRTQSRGCWNDRSRFTENNRITFEADIVASLTLQLSPSRKRWNYTNENSSFPMVSKFLVVWILL